MRGWGVSDHPRDCPHGRQWGKCDTCDLIEANKRIAALEAENERLNQLSVDLRACMVEARHKLGLEQDKNDELRAVAQEVLSYTDYIRPLGPRGQVLRNAALAALEAEVGE
jgi:hypothetical protein